MNEKDISGASHGSWNEQKQYLKARFPDLTEDDLDYDKSKKEAMMNMVQRKLGKTRDEFNRILSTL